MSGNYIEMGSVGLTSEAGRLIRKAATDPKELKKLKKDPKKYFEDVIDFGDFEVVVHVNSDNTKHIVVPFGDALMHPIDYKIPAGYDPDHPVNHPANLKEGYDFRIGDYTFAECG